MPSPAALVFLAWPVLVACDAGIGEVEQEAKNSTSVGLPVFESNFTEEDFQKAEVAVGEVFAEASSVSSVGYDSSEAKTFARISAAAFCRTAGPGMTDTRFIDGGGMFAMAGRFAGRCVVAFRGSDNLLNVGSDLISVTMSWVPGCAGCQVGTGFQEAYMAVAAGVEGALHGLGCRQVSVTGHSLGAAVAVLAMRDLRARGFELAVSYTFGQPRVGNRAYHQAWEEARAGVPVYRFVHGNDPFVNMGPLEATGHEGQRVYLPGSDVLTDHGCYLGIAFRGGFRKFLQGCGFPCNER